MTTFKVVACLWNDACSYRDGELENIDNEMGVKRLSFGLLRRDTEDYVLIQHDAEPQNMAKSSYFIKIPKSLIIKIYKIGSIEINEIIKGD